MGSYFAHYFSPERLPKMTTHTVFLLDVSLSMYNGKLDSMKEAMKTILKDMQQDDTYEVSTFIPPLLPTSSNNKNKKS